MHRSATINQKSILQSYIKAEERILSSVDARTLSMMWSTYGMYASIGPKVFGIRAAYSALPAVFVVGISEPILASNTGFIYGFFREV